MKSTLLVFLALASAVVVAQEMTDVERAAKVFAAVAPLPPELENEVRGRMRALGDTKETVDKRIAQAVDDFSMCLVNSALDQARSQGISEEALLKSLTGQPVTPVQQMEADRFDMPAFGSRSEICRRVLRSDLEIE